MALRGSSSPSVQGWAWPASTRGDTSPRLRC